MNNDPCPSCDGDEYDEAAGECSECGFELDPPTCAYHDPARPAPCGGHSDAQVSYTLPTGPVIIYVCRYHHWWLRRTRVQHFRTLVESPTEAPLLGLNDRSLE